MKNSLFCALVLASVSAYACTQDTCSHTGDVTVQPLATDVQVLEQAVEVVSQVEVVAPEATVSEAAN